MLGMESKEQRNRKYPESRSSPPHFHLERGPDSSAPFEGAHLEAGGPPSDKRTASAESSAEEVSRAASDKELNEAEAMPPEDLNSSSELAQISISGDEDSVERSTDTDKSGLYVPGYSGLLHKWQHPGYEFFTSQQEKEIFPETERLLKLIIVGDATVGKTSFVQRYVNDVFRTNYKGTIGVDFALKCLWKSGTEMIKLQLWDIAGQERFTWMTRAYYRGADGCIVMFDLTSNSSFINAFRWKQDVDSKCQLPDGSPLPTILVGNKCDLSHRAVNQEEIELVFKTHNYVAWTEVSAKDNLMVSECINFLVEAMVDRNLGEVTVKCIATEEGKEGAIANGKHKKRWQCC